MLITLAAKDVPLFKHGTTYQDLQKYYKQLDMWLEWPTRASAESSMRAFFQATKDNPKIWRPYKGPLYRLLYFRVDSWAGLNHGKTVILKPRKFTSWTPSLVGLKKTSGHKTPFSDPGKEWKRKGHDDLMPYARVVVKARPNGLCLDLMNFRDLLKKRSRELWRLKKSHIGTDLEEQYLKLHQGVVQLFGLLDFWKKESEVVVVGSGIKKVSKKNVVLTRWFQPDN